MCFIKEGKYDQAARCIKSRIMTKVIDSVLSIDTFEQQCVVLKVMLQSLRLKYHVQTIGIEPSLSNNTIHEHKCIEIIKRLYKPAGKCDDQKKFKDILEAAVGESFRIRNHSSLNNIFELLLDVTLTILFV